MTVITRPDTPVGLYPLQITGKSGSRQLSTSVSLFVNVRVFSRVDFDADGKRDLAVYRGGWWLVLQSSTDTELGINLGGSINDIPVPADYDGDGMTDAAVYRGGWWYVQRSSLGYLERAYDGAVNDIPVPGDYDGDGKTDFAVYRGGWWYVLQSSTGTEQGINL